ncbi:MAG: hypothetical protein ACRDHP_13010 [Ktedonobacterales bacterium]
MSMFRNRFVGQLPMSQRWSLSLWWLLTAPLLVALAASSCAPTTTGKGPGSGQTNALRQVTLPLGYSVTSASDGSNSVIGSGYTVSAQDGNVAYACVVATSKPSATVSVWLTRDGAVHWTQVGTLASPQSVTSCGVTPDELDTNTAAIVLNWTPPGGQWMPSTTVSYMTTDAGTHWRKLTGSPAYTVGKLTSRNGHVYEVRTIQVDASGTTARRLFVSDDQFHTWRPIDSTFASNLNSISAFWADPTSNMLLASVNSGPETTVLWSSADGGAHWQQVQLPIQSRNTITVTFPGNAPARICVWSLGGGAPSTGPGEALSCSADGGQTWQSETTNSTSSPSIGGPAITPLEILGIDGNGAVLSNGADMQGNSAIYILLAGSNEWVPLWRVPSQNFTLEFGLNSGKGVVWIFSNSTSGSGDALFTGTYAS